ncbi:MAG: glycosyltransferase family 2 protein [Candidatus Helarchaeota archaeon]|nr:glycosyltransferase family 2 protein [Candidatus Helarchaeota archaeon]
MPKLLHVGWTLLALSFFVIIFSFFGFLIYEGFLFIFSNPQSFLDFFIWPLSVGGIIGIVGEFCWIAFLAGGSLLIIHVIKKVLTTEKRPEVVGASKINREDVQVITVIPAYNEEQNIGEVISRTFKHSDKVVVINDGSTDATEKVAKEAKAIVKNHIVNRGLGLTIRDGINEAMKLGADIIVTIDADGQYDADQIPDILEPILDGRADLVLGSRFMKGTIIHMPRLKRLGNKIITLINRNLMNLDITDAQTGFRAIKREVFEHIILTAEYTYTQEMIIRAAAEGFYIKDVPVNFYERKHGESRLIRNPAEYGLNTAMTMLRAYRDYRPMTLFGTIGVLMMFIGTLIGLYIVYEFFVLGTFETGQRLVTLSALMIMTGIQVLLFGLLADMMSRHFIKKRTVLRS